jgi:predicted nuclease with TOPRIM domain
MKVLLNNINEEIENINNNLSWIEEKLDIAFEKVSQLEENYPEEEEEIEKGYADIDYLLKLIGSEKETLLNLEKQIDELIRRN